MKRYIHLIIYMLLANVAMAQRPAYHKMSALVREAAMDQTLKSNRAKTKGRHEGRQATLTAFVKLKSGNAEYIFADYGCNVLSKIGEIYIVSIPLNSLSDLSRSSFVARIEAGQRSEVQMDTTRQFVNVDKVYQGIDLPEGYTGKNVIVGVQDIGFDLTHPTFYSRDMSRYRIKALWDQLSKDTIGSALPVGRDYTTETDLLAIGHPLDGLTQTHGTHTAGIAAGGGAEGVGVQTPYYGIAYDADIVMVANATGNNVGLIDKANYYKYTYATDALGFKYMFDYADRVGKPCVINFSEGGHQDLIGDDELYYQILNSLTGPGHIIVASAGNDADWVNYVHKPVGRESVGAFVQGNKVRLMFTIKSAKPFMLRYKLYKDKANSLLKEIATASVLASKDSTFTDSLLIGDEKIHWHITAYPSSLKASETVYDLRMWSNSFLGETTPISLELVGKEADIELYRISGKWVQNKEIDAELFSGDNSHSIHSPSSAPSVISVGATAYREGFLNYRGEWKNYSQGTGGRLTSFSGIGPTLDGRIKPDVVAPGQNIISAYSSFYINNPDNVGFPLSSDTRHFMYNGKEYAWNSNSGTSMSGPVVAGAIALWLQAYPSLTPDDCRKVFAKTCTHYDAALSYPNNMYGYGQIDIHEGLKEVLRMAAQGIERVEDIEAKALDNRIYSLDGRYLGTSVSGLPKGVYVRKHKKFVVR